MLYNRHLETFIQVADCGSFLKASEKLYVSANAVAKQINLLERELDLRLFERSTQGLTLTDAGRMIYGEAKKLIRHSDTVLKKARELEHHREYVIRLGVSLMNPADLLLEQWHKAARQYPNIRLEIVPFEDTVPSFTEVLNELGKKIDIVPCPYESSYWGNRYNYFHLKDIPLRIACSKSHRLAEKSLLTLSDLHGETLITKKREIASSVGGLLEEIAVHHSQIHTMEGDYFDINTFNHVVNSDDLILSTDCWSQVHPFLATLPVDWDYTTPYGLIYSREPADEVTQFIMAIGQVEEDPADGD